VTILNPISHKRGGVLFLNCYRFDIITPAIAHIMARVNTSCQAKSRSLGFPQVGDASLPSFDICEMCIRETSCNLNRAFQIVTGP